MNVQLSKQALSGVEHQLKSSSCGSNVCYLRHLVGDGQADQQNRYSGTQLFYGFLILLDHNLGQLRRSSVA